ncbi:MAG: helix-turn-helix domain-containing protein [Bacteroidetes bacterium]|nr:helix-turn-helix domain-containing protein [Bacteroidota bacterium]
MELLSIHQASQILNNSRQWVWFLIKMGRIKARLIGKSFVIKESDLNKYIESKNKVKREN